MRCNLGFLQSALYSYFIASRVASCSKFLQSTIVPVSNFKTEGNDKLVAPHLKKLLGSITINDGLTKTNTGDDMPVFVNE